MAVSVRDALTGEVTDTNRFSDLIKLVIKSGCLAAASKRRTRKSAKKTKIEGFDPGSE